MFLLKRRQKLILKDCQQEAGLLRLLAPALLVGAGPAALRGSSLRRITSLTRFLATTESCEEAVRGTSGHRKNSPNRPGGSRHFLATITKLHSSLPCVLTVCVGVGEVRVHMCENIEHNMNRPCG